MTMTYEQQLLKLLESDPRLVVLTAENRAAIRNMPAKIGERFIDVGICEQTMVAAAAGLALRGRIPVVHALACFLVMRAYEFIRTDVGIGRLPVKLVGYVPGFLSTANGPTHQAIEDIALMRGIPGMQIYCPADSDELVGMLPSILDSAAPCYIRYNDCAPRVTHLRAANDCRAEVFGEDKGVTLITAGFLLGEVERARQMLTEQGVPTRVINLRRVKPIDEDILLSAARESKLLVTVEDHLLAGGIYSIVAETLVKHGVNCRVKPLALQERWFRPGLLNDVLRKEGFTGDQIAGQVREAL